MWQAGGQTCASFSTTHICCCFIRFVCLGCAVSDINNCATYNFAFLQHAGISIETNSHLAGCCVCLPTKMRVTHCFLPGTFSLFFFFIAIFSSYFFFLSFLFFVLLPHCSKFSSIINHIFCGFEFMNLERATLFFTFPFFLELEKFWNLICTQSASVWQILKGNLF